MNNVYSVWFDSINGVSGSDSGYQLMIFKTRYFSMKKKLLEAKNIKRKLYIHAKMSLVILKALNLFLSQLRILLS